MNAETTSTEYFPKWFMWGTDCLMQFNTENEGQWHHFKVGGVSPILSPMEFYLSVGAGDGFMRQITEEEAQDILRNAKH